MRPGERKVLERAIWGKRNVKDLRKRKIWEKERDLEKRGKWRNRLGKRDLEKDRETWGNKRSDLFKETLNWANKREEDLGRNDFGKKEPERSRQEEERKAWKREKLGEKKKNLKKLRGTPGKRGRERKRRKPENNLQKETDDI
ncbi:hypothetical protein Zmor_022468 [Zophobas morio]|uniref:Uncharacterized protein n=1 Tax=Zophobas morio TaxID=2755281 RepID=A0AA38HWZ3_9CUCU|nr:hypothetical protein Zmor_022468 [Zophobas morio]